MTPTPDQGPDSPIGRLNALIQELSAQIHDKNQQISKVESDLHNAHIERKELKEEIEKLKTSQASSIVRIDTLEVNVANERKLRIRAETEIRREISRGPTVLGYMAMTAIAIFGAWEVMLFLHDHFSIGTVSFEKYSAEFPGFLLICVISSYSFYDVAYSMTQQRRRRRAEAQMNTEYQCN